MLRHRDTTPFAPTREDCLLYTCYIGQEDRSARPTKVTRCYRGLPLKVPLWAVWL